MSLYGTANTSATLDHKLALQINDLDSYQATPTKLDRLHTAVCHVPIIRVYGTITVPGLPYIDESSKRRRVDPDPQVFNVLIHVHNYFPYVYIDCDDKSSSTDEIRDKLEAILVLSFSKKKSEEDDTDIEPPDSSLRKYVASVDICSGLPIYGYQVGHRLLYKVSLLHPVYKARIVKLVQDGTVKFGKKKCQVYEGHITFYLQFLADLNLYACGWMYCSSESLYFRSPILNPRLSSYLNKNQLDSLMGYLHLVITKTNVLAHGDITLNHTRIGRSLLEVDISTESIVNRKIIDVRELHKTFAELELFELLKNSQGDKRHTYLSSLRYVFSDLKFQLLQKDSSFQLELEMRLIFEQSKFQSGAKHCLGTNDGSTNWSNQIDLDELLHHAIKVNGRVRKHGVKAGLDSLLDSPRVQQLLSVQTCYELANKEIIGNPHPNLGAEILQWDDFESLFAIDKDLGVLENSSIRPELQDDDHGSFSEILDDEDGFADDDEANGHTPNKVPNHEEEDLNEGENMIVNGVDEGGMNAVDMNEESMNDDDINNGVHLDESDIDVTQLGEYDRQVLFDMTQRRTQLNFKKGTVMPVQVQVPSSLEIPQCDLNIPLSQNAFEVPVPDNLHPDNISKDFEVSGMLAINYQDPFYDSKDDVLPRPLIFAGKKIQVPVKELVETPMSKFISQEVHESTPSTAVAHSFSSWVYLINPPSKSSVHNWFTEEERRSNARKQKFKSQIEPFLTQHLHKLSYNSLKVQRRKGDFNMLTCFHLEILSATNNSFAPDPYQNPVTAMFYSFDNSNNMHGDADIDGVLLIKDTMEDVNLGQVQASSGAKVFVFDTEEEMVTYLLGLVERFDPDILSGYEVNASSWGYLIERFRVVHDINLCAELSRSTFKSNGKFGDRWGYTHTANFQINGRHVLNIWRVLRSEMNLTSYTLENISYHLLHHNLPRYLNEQLSRWIFGDFASKILVLRYFMRRIELTLKIVTVQEVITRNVEHSRLIGVDFNSNFYRGSQFKVESILLRLTKPENIVLNSPSKQQVHEMRSLECIPLVMEPDSNFYKSPLVVLDFQSLYPSVMIAYNYCFSTLVSRLHNFKPRSNPIGYLKNVRLEPGILGLLEERDALNISPNGYVFVKSKVRKSILAKMLEEMLDTRIVVKTGMKKFSDDPELMKLYNARQLALKLIANVTYGYTSATYSGRMPNSDVADAIVSTGREILTQSIDIIENGDFGAKVVYGDTDSLFVYFPGKSKADAFKLGRQIAELVTNLFPDPVTLKMEKVYHPCVLLTKKRYVGYSYELESQQDPKFDAKGIETVRRDGIPAQLKMVEKCLRILFETKNLSKVKQYVMEQFYKISANKIPLNEFIFAKEVRYGTYKNEAHLPPGALLAEKKTMLDPRKEPQYRERVPYVVIRDSTKQRLKDRCISPEDFIALYNGANKLYPDYEYYIVKALIPPLERLFNLIGVDVRAWYRELPRYIESQSYKTNTIFDASTLIAKKECIQCGESLLHSTLDSLCSLCLSDELQLLTNLTMQQRNKLLKLFGIDMTCSDCVLTNILHINGPIKGNAVADCQNLDCKMFYQRFKVKNDVEFVSEQISKALADLSW